MPQQVKSYPTNSFKTKPPHTMEIIGLSLALVPLFNAAIDCFTLVKMAKSFDADLELNVVRLEVLHLRLARWGEAAGLGKHIDDSTMPDDKPLTHQEATIKRSLEQIQARFENAVKVVQDQDTGDAVSAAELSEKSTLVRKFHNMSIKRHARTRVATKAKWVIYQKEKPESLIEELSELLNNLDRVQPADVTVLTPICDDEASKLLENERLRQASVAMLENVAGKLDGRLADSIARRKAKLSASARRNSPRNILTS